MPELPLPLEVDEKQGEKPKHCNLGKATVGKAAFSCWEI